MLNKLRFRYGFVLAVATIIYYLGIYEYCFTTSYDIYYTHWGHFAPLTDLIIKTNGESFTPSNSFNINNEKCKGEIVDIVLLVKSKYNNFELREAIRQTWGNDNRFKKPIIKTIFMLGKSLDEPLIQKNIELEANLHGDIVQGHFTDRYYNITRKTKMTIRWAFHNCWSNHYIMIDDDYYLSIINLIKFIRSPYSYPNDEEQTMVNDYLYAGYVFSNSVPIRFYLSKWYIPLKYYKYSKFPPYITGGISILSKKSFDILYIACEHTDYFKFDDIFLGMAAKLVGLKLLHINEIYFDKKIYLGSNYKNVIATHGYSSPSELIYVFNKQLHIGEA